MSQSGQNGNHGAFRAGEWQVEPSRNVITRPGATVHLEPRVMDVLVHLASRCGQVVTKEELVEQVWAGRHVTDDVLTVSIYSLRKALGDAARQPQYIETISRRGYRWLVPPQPVVREETRLSAPARRLTLRWLAAGLAAATLLAAAGLATLRSPGRRAESPGAAEARLAYTRGRFILDQRNPIGWEPALDHFRQAIALDPDAPAAHAGLADTYSHMVDCGAGNSEELRPLAFAAAARAVALDPRSAEGHAAQGRARFLFDWDFAGAERDLRRAVELDPSYMPARQGLAWVHSATGRYEAAIAESRRALELDPVNTARYMELGWVLSLAGQHAAGVQEIDRGLELNPRLFAGYLLKSWILAQGGDQERAFTAYRDGLRLAGAPPEAATRMEAVYREGGMPAIYRYWARPEFRNVARGFSHTFRAQLHARAGDLDGAIASLEQAYRKREGALAWMGVEPSFRPLRTDARFQRIAGQVGAQNSWRSN